jgi:hypothetical protein
MVMGCVLGLYGLVMIDGNGFGVLEPSGELLAPVMAPVRVRGCNRSWAQVSRRSKRNILMDRYWKKRLKQ